LLANDTGHSETEACEISSESEEVHNEAG
jgi:hypothetical protein